MLVASIIKYVDLVCTSLEEEGEEEEKDKEKKKSDAGKGVGGGGGEYWPKIKNK